MVDQTGNGTAKVVGKIAGTEGYVFIVDSDGNRHLVEAGEEVRIGQTLETLGGGAVVVTLANNKSFSLGQNQELTIDQRLIKLLEEIKEEDSLDEAINFDLIAQAFESGQNVEDILPAAAAGGDNAPASSSSAGASAARIERTAGEVTPEGGFETEALVNSPNDFNPPNFNEGFDQSSAGLAGNSRPVTLEIDDFTIDQDQQYTLDLSQYFSDADAGQSLTYSVENLPEGLIFDPATGIISGSPTNDSALSNGGAYSIIVTASDNSGSENSSVTSSFNLNINNLNDSPVAGASVGVGSVAEDTALEISSADLLAGVQDIDGDSLSVTNITVTSGEGVLSVNDDGNYVYSPSDNWNGDVILQYVVGDGQGGQVTNTATLTVTAVNDAPVAVNDGLIGLEVNSSLTLDVLANDYDVDGDTITITGVSAGQGTVTVNDDGTVTYTPNQDFIGRDVLSYTISDGNGGQAGSLALVNIIVGNVAPAMADDASVTVPEDTLEVGNFAASDADGDVISYNLSGSDANLFTIDSSGTLSFISAPDFEADPGPFSVTITATDDGIGNLSASQTLTISISDAPENTAPVLGVDTTLDVAENTLEIGNFAATDAEGNNITYSLSGPDADSFSIGVAGNLTFISAPDFENSSGPFSVVINASDGSLNSTQAITVNVANANDAPSASSPISSASSEGAANYTVDLLAGASDQDAADILSVADLTLLGGDTSGITVNGNSIEIDPSAYNSLAVGESEVISYRYTIEDGNGGAVVQTATITIAGANDGPSVTSALTSFATESTATYSIDLLAGTNDPDTSDVLNVSDLTLTSGNDAGVTINGNGLDVNPSAYAGLAEGETEVIEYSYTITDGNGGSVAQTATITVTGVNGNPVVSGTVTSAASEDDGTYSLDLLSGASDPDSSDILSVSGLTLVSGDASGININGNSLDINPSAYNGLAVGESETITYSYSIEDGNGGTIAQTATVTFNGANDGPSVTAAVTSSASEDAAGYSVDLLAGASDLDSSDTLSVVGLTLVNGNASGVSINGSSLDIDSNAYNALAIGESEAITYNYTIEDGNGGSIAQTATITVTGANDAPSVSSAIVSTVSEDNTNYSIDLLAGASDVDVSDTLGIASLTLTGGDASGITINGNSLDVNPAAYNHLAAGESEVISYSYTIEDGNGGSVSQTATITVAGENDSPSIMSAITSTVSEDASTYSIDLLAGASDPDTSDTLNVAGMTLLSGNDSGITINGNSLDIDPAAYNSLGVGESETITYNYTIEDGNGGSVAQTATITVTGANDNPNVGFAVTSSATEDTAAYSLDLLVGASDPDSTDTLTVSALTLTGGDASGITASGNSLNIDPSAYNSLAVGESEIITYAYTVEDGNGGSIAQTATVTITGENDGPSVASAVTSSTTENTTSYSVNLLGGASDPDSSDVLALSDLTLVSGNDSGITVNGNNLDVNPSAYASLANGETEVIEYSYFIVDGNGGSVHQTATITITGENGNPVVSGNVASTASEDDGTYSVDLLAGASDPDTSDTLSVAGLALVGGNASGVTVNGNSLEIDPTAYNSLAAGESEIITYSYTVEDNNGGSTAQTATITITGANDGPTVGSAITSTAGEDSGTYSLDLLTDAADPDASDILTVTGLALTSGDDSGITINGNSLDINTSAYNALAVGESEVITYSYTIEDGNGGSIAQTATITVTGANDGPSVASAVTSSASENGASYVVDLLTNASDPDVTDTLNVSGLTLTAGTNSGITVNGNVLEVDPGAYNHLAVGESEIISYSYLVDDGNGGSVAQTATITINGENDGPSVASAVVSTAMEDDAAYSLDLLAGASDPDISDTLNVAGLTLSSGDASGIVINGNFLNIDPAAYNSLASGETEVITYSYTIEDGNGSSIAQTATITITGTNDGPGISSAVVSSASEDDSAYSINLLTGASDPDASDTLNVAGLTLAGGDASGIIINGNSLDIDPGAYNSLAVGETEVITYDYTIEDGNGGSVAQTATITITGANDGPSVSSAVVSSATENTAAYSLDLLTNASDADTSDTLSITGLTLIGGDDSGVTVNGSSLDIDPSVYAGLADGETEVIEYSYTITDSNGGSVIQTATITVTGGNGDPVVSGAVVSNTSEDSAAYSVDLLAGSSDPDSSDTLTVAGLALVSGDASGIAINGNFLDVDPSAYNALAVGESETVTYSYTIEDGNGGSTAQTATITISGANDGPSVSAALTSSVSEDASSYSMDLLAGASDPDSSDSLSVTDLVLTGGDASGITVNGNTLDIDPNAYNSLAVGESEIISYSYSIEDGNGGLIAQTATITITGANDGPSVSSALVSSASEDDATYSIDLLAGATDPDTSDALNVVGLTLISGDASGIAIGSNSLSVNPNAYTSLAVGESEVITYSYIVEDGNGGSVAQTATITITGANDGPTVGSAIVSSVSEDDVSYSMDLLTSASDPDASDVLNVTALTLLGGDASGIAINGNSLDVNPSAYNSLAAGETEIISYSYSIEDGNGGSVAQTATITITGANDVPVVTSSVTSSTSEDTAAYSVDLLANASDVDASDTLSATGVTLVSGNAAGITVNGNSLDINPGAYNSLANGESEIVVYSFTVEDGNGGSVAQTATITITGANDGPSIGSAITSSATEDGSAYSVDLLAGASDPDSSDTLSVSGLTLVSGNAAGITVNGNTIDVSPSVYNALAAGESEVITYSYTIEDGSGGSVAQTATITITGANDGPGVGSAITSTASEDAATYPIDLLSGASDPDSSDSLSVVGLTLTGGNATGIAVVGNSLNVDPSAYNGLAAGETEVVTYNYTIEDGNGGSVAQTATITITGTNDGPSVSSSVVSSASEDDSAYSVDLLAGASDPDISDSLMVAGLTLASGNAAGITINGNSLDVNPNAYNSLAAGESEVITYSYTVEDGNGGSIAQTVTITINGANDGPSVTGAVVSNATENTAAYSLDLLAGASDPDTSDTLSISGLTLTGGDDSGITINGNNLDIDPSAYVSLAAGETEVIEYSYTILDGNGGSVAQIATVTITGGNNEPVISGAVTSVASEDDTNYSLDLLAGASDPDTSDTLNIAGLTLVGGNAAGVTLNGNTLDIDPNVYNALAVGESEIITYTYTVEDGNGGSVAQTATITIAGANDSPDISGATTLSASEDASAYSLSLLAGASDPDASDSLSVTGLTLTSGDASGITVNGNTLDVNPNAYNALAVGESEVISYSYAIEDGNGGSIAQTATITITGANDAPNVSSVVTSTVSEDVAGYSVDLLAGSSDADATDILAVVGLTLSSGDASGVTVNGDSLDINPDAYNRLAVGENEIITYSYTVEDGKGGSVAQTATITVTGANDTPTIGFAITSTISEDGAAYSLDLLAGATDADASDVLNIAGLTLTSGDASGITINGNSLDVNPDTYNSLAVGESEIITYSYVIEDGNGGSVAQTVTITVDGANDVPSVSGAVVSSATENSTAYSLDLLAGAFDPDTSDTLTVTGVTLSSGSDAGVIINGNSLDIDPSAYAALAVGETEVIEYSYTVVDGNGGSVAQTATITITGGNGAPEVSGAVTSNASEDSAVYSLNLLAGASDPDSSDSLSVVGLTLAGGDASGVSVNGNSLNIDPNAYNTLASGESEVITYNYTIEDGNGGSVAQTATITITGANDAPTIGVAINSTASEDAATYSVDLLTGASDPDTSDSLNIVGLTLAGGDASGITVNGNSLDVDSSAYNALAVGQSEIITYSYTIEDGNGGSVAQTATITVTGSNDAPSVSSALVSSASEDDATYSVDLRAGASDPDATDVLTVAVLTLTAGDASGITVNGNSLEVDPNAYGYLAAGESEVITYSYNVEDGNGGSIAQTATITISGANDGPTVTGAVVSSALEDDLPYSVDLLTGASDPDVSDILSVTGVTLISGDASGISVNGNTLDVDPTAYNSLAVGESEVIVYNYTIDDGNGGSVVQTATVTIHGSNDAPGVASVITSTASEDGAQYSLDLLAGASDADASDILTVAGLTLTGGDVSGISVNGNSLDIDPGAYNHLAAGESEVISYSYSIEDGNGGSVAQTATITINGSNDNPTVSSAITSSASEDAAAYSVGLLVGVSDPDTSNTLSVSGVTLISGDASGISINGDMLDVDPSSYNNLATGESEVIVYNYTVEDGNGGSIAQTATITITGANDGPSIDLDLNNSTTPGNNYQATYAEGGSAVRVVDTDITVTDIDSTQLQGASITITNVEAGDLLSAGTLPSGITASAYNPATGTITLSGTASIVNYQTAIRAIQFSNDGSASGSSRSIEVTVNDGFDSSNVAMTTVNMVLVPTVSITDVSVQEPVSGTTTLVFTVSIDQTLASDLSFNYNTADVSATAGPDYVGVSGGAGTIIAGSSSTTITITINSDANNFEGDETFAVNLSAFNQTVNFPSGGHTITGGVQGIGTIGANNGAPDAVDDSFITSEDTTLVTGNVFSNDTLVDNADYSAHDITSAEGGTVTYNGDGTFTYTPASGFGGTDSFTYSVIDDDGETDTATVTVEVTDVPVNPPVVTSVPDIIYTENDSPQSLLSGISLSDIDSTTLSSVVVRVDGYIASQDAMDYLTAGTSVNASVAISGNTWELTLTNGANINEYLSVLGSLTYQNTSENPSTASRTITVEAYDQDYNNLFDSDSGTITVVAENDAPTTTDNDTFYVSNSVDNNLNITAPFDVDTDDATLVITVTGLPTSVGNVTLADGTPVNIGDTLTLAQLTSLQLDAGAAEGTDTFTYTVFDGELATVGTTTINVGDSEPDISTVYESALGDGTGVDSGSTVATGNLFTNDAAADGSTTLDSIEYNSATYTPVSGVIAITTALGTLTVYANNSTPGFSAGDYEYVLNSADGSGANVNESFTYNFTSGVSIQDTLTITVVDDQPVANNLVEDIPESEEQVFNLVFTLDISTSMNAEVGSTGLTRLDLAKQALVALAREYFDQSTQVSLTVLLFANGAHILGSYDNFTDAEVAIAGVTDNQQTAYANHLGSGNLTDATDYNDALTLIEQEFTADLAGQNSADNVQNISYFLSDGAITAGGTVIGNGFDGFVNSNSIDSYSVGIGTGLPSDLRDLNFIHNIDSLGQGNGHVDDALIVSDVSLLESELLSTVPTAFGGNITVDGSISNVEFGADGGFVSSIGLELGGTPYTFTYDGSSITVPGALTNLDVEGSKVTFNSDDGFSFGTFTFDFSDGSYLFIAPNGAAGSTFNFDFTVLDGDGDSASATAVINIVDDRPDARDDLHTTEVFETAQGNVVTGIGTDGGPKLGTGFTAFAVQGGGVDKVVDNAKVTEFTYKGTQISLDLTLLFPPAPTGASANVAINNSTNFSSADFNLSSASGVGFNNNGAGVTGGRSGNTLDDQDSNPLTITFDATELPYGVDNLVLGLNDFQSGNGDAVTVTIYDIAGAVIGVRNHYASNGSNLDLSDYSGIGSVDIDYTGGGRDAQLSNVAYDPTQATPQPSPTSGNNGSNLSWEYSYETDLDGNGVFQAIVTDANDGSTFTMRSNGYYEYTPDQSAAPVTVSESFVDSSADQGVIATTTDNGSPTITFNATAGAGIGVSSTGDQWDDSADGGDNVILTFDSGLYPFGIEEITMTFGYDAGTGTAIFYDEFGAVIDSVALTGNDTQTFSGVSGVHSMEITTGGDGDFSIQQIDFRGVPNPATVPSVLAPVLVDYVLTDSDGQSDSAQLAIHTTDNQITGTVSSDSISGGNMNDAIFGDDGDDILSGGAGHDTISGGAGVDIISGNADSDYLTGGDNSDELYGGSGNDHLAGDAGNDLLDGGLGDDIALGGDGNDLIFGGAGNDRLEGGAGDDSIYGGAGNDSLFGDKGDDIIFGGTGDDSLTGGDNIDTFVWQVTDAGSTDTITDFETGLYGDILNFSDLLQGESADAVSLDTYFSISSDGSDTTLQIDIDGDGSGTDMTVILQGVDLTLLGSEQQILQQLLDDGNLMTN